MNRRDFFNLFELKLDERQEQRASLIQTLDEKATPLTKEDAYHLLRRLTFGADVDLVNQLTGMSASDAVDYLLGDGLDYLPENESRLPGGVKELNWINTAEENPMAVPLEIRFEIEGKHGNRYYSFINWWLNKMHNYDSSPNAISREKITMFWHTHWCIAFNYDTQDMIPPPLLYRNNQKLRKHRLGNFQRMAEEMTLDGAYLLYQSLNLNTKNDPNENYMRELMELFTMGIGNYEERDIVQGTRALTGWRVSAHLGNPKPFDFFDTYFSPADHDLGKKTILGEDIAPRNIEDNSMEKVKEEEVYKLISILFKRRGDAISKFIATKVYRYFVYSNPNISDTDFVNEIAAVFKANNYELLPMFKALFKSEHFFASANRGCQIKAPTDYIIGLQKNLGVDFYSASSSALEDLEQHLYNPPNVSGWQDYRSWISTITYPNRISRANSILNTMTIDKIKSLLDRFGKLNSHEVLAELTTLLLPIPVSNEQKDYFHSILRAGKNEQQWIDAMKNNDSWLYTNIKNTIKEIFYSPDFQLS